MISAVLHLSGVSQRFLLLYRRLPTCGARVIVYVVRSLLLRDALFVPPCLVYRDRAKHGLCPYQGQSGKACTPFV